MTFAGIIPARYASTRFPGKPLAIIGGKTMIERVYNQVTKVLDNAYVATDDARIEQAVKAFGGNVIMTSPNHQSGTDRIAEAVIKLKSKGEMFDVIVNIQGDEPFIQPEQIKSLCSCFDRPATQIATLVEKITSYETLFNPNSPKVVLDGCSNTLYFSRNPIPYLRGKDQNTWLDHHTYFKHIGIYAYKTDVLLQIAKLAPSKLELAESLEQLRWLENGYEIKCAQTTYEGLAVDTPQDLQRVNDWLSKQKTS
mgnify:CR=1 FL=1